MKMLSIAFILGVGGLVLSGAKAEEPAGSLETKEQTETTRLITAELPKWQFWTGADRQKPLVLEPKSLLKWSNPGTGRVYGDVYLWTYDGRPEVIMSLFKAWEPANGFHVELHSMSLGEVAGDRDGQAFWNPKTSGVQSAAVPDAPRPAASPTQRLLQMKAIARDFSINLRDRRVNDSGENQSLRLLPQPLYRYPEDGSRDGALFTFALGTDPEIFLLLETREDAWHYSLARMNDGSLTVQYKKQDVWKAERAAERDRMNDPYVLNRVPEEP